MVRVAAIALLGGALLAPAALAQSPAELRISQGAGAGSDVTVYLEVLDKNRQSVALPLGTLSATVGSNSADVVHVSYFLDTAEPVAYLFLVDVSRSLSAGQFQRMIQGLKSWIGALRPGDQVSIVTFGDSIRTVQDFTSDIRILNEVVGGLRAQDGRTQLFGAVVSAMDHVEARRVQLPARTVAVLLSDGRDNFLESVGKDVAMQRVRTRSLPIYVASVAPVRSSRREAANTLSELAYLSGGGYVNAGPVPETYTLLKARILGVHVVRLRCRRCASDGSSQHVRIEYAPPGGPPLATGLDIRVMPSMAVIPTWTWVLLAVSILSLMTGIILLRRKPVGEIVPWGEIPNVPARSHQNPKTPWRPALEPLPLVPDPPRPRPNGPSIRVRLTTMDRQSMNRPRDLDLTNKIVVGRDPDADLPFTEDTSMSARHFQLSLVDGAVVLHDLSSRNGTRVNGIFVRDVHKMEDGDVIIAGTTEMRINFNVRGGRLI